MQAETQSPPFQLPDRTVVFFREKAERNERATELAGAPRYDRVVIAALRAPGQKSSEHCFEAARFFPDELVEARAKEGKPLKNPKESPELNSNRPIRDANNMQVGFCCVRQIYDPYINQQKPSDSGMPLEMWSAVDVTQVATLKHVNIYTVEQLADLPDGFLPNTGLGLNARELRTKAQAYLAHAAGAGKVEALAARVERFEGALAEKDKEIEELRRENARLASFAPAPAPKPPRRRGGRAAPKVDDVEGDVAASMGGRVDADEDADEDGDFV